MDTTALRQKLASIHQDQVLRFYDDLPPASKDKPLFQVFAEQLLAHSRDAGKPIAWYIMTSDNNDAPTRAFFQQHNHFGYDPRNIFIFPQGMMPAFAMDGSLLLAEKDSLALS